MMQILKSVFSVLRLKVNRHIKQLSHMSKCSYYPRLVAVRQRRKFGSTSDFLSKVYVCSVCNCLSVIIFNDEYVIKQAQSSQNKNYVPLIVPESGDPLFEGDHRPAEAVYNQFEDNSHKLCYFLAFIFVKSRKLQQIPYFYPLKKRRKFENCPVTSKYILL